MTAWDRWRLFLLGLFVAALAGCASTARAPVEGRAMAPDTAPEFYTVRRGDTLYSIAWMHDLDYLELANWNRILPPHTIYPNQRLVVKAPAFTPETQAIIQPEERSKPVAPLDKQPVKPAPRPKPETKMKRTVVKPKPAATTQAQKRGRGSADKKGKTAVKKEVAETVASRWIWPTKGAVKRRFAHKKNKGLDIGGRSGQPIVAAANGEVVYSGSGLIGYGKLIIIKHNRDHLSAYAYNERLRVKEGDRVSAGQHIADMGLNKGGKPRLHFEIRRKGKPMNPLHYLPRGRG